MPLLTHDTACTYTMHGVTFTSHANSSTGATRLAGWSAQFDPRTPGQEHRMSSEELLHVLDGSLDIEIDGDAFTAGAGDTVLVPARAAFRVSNVTDQPARAWVVTTLGMTATMTTDGTTINPSWAQ